jgi:succinate--hydroxymethylglutarate CoA-transferase
LRERERLTDLLDEALSARTTADWMAVFGGSIPAAPILDVAQALDNPFVHQRGGVERIPVEGNEVLSLLSCPIRSQEPAGPGRRAPALGEHTDDVLDAIGVTAQQRQGLRSRGVIG